MKLNPFLVFVFLLPVSSAFAEWKETDKSSKSVDPLRKDGYSVNAITPVFSQLVAFPYPEGFEIAYEKTTGPSYIQESVLHGETPDKWTQMITLTGAKESALNPKATPPAVISALAQGFTKACPSSYAGSGLGELKFGEYDGFAAVVSCGTAKSTGEPYSESTLMVAVRGKNDFYTVQWAVRGAPSSTPISINDAEWAERLKKITPIKLCPIVLGEAAPYPSCVDKK